MVCIVMAQNCARYITRILRSDALHARLWEINAITPFSSVMTHCMEVRSGRTTIIARMGVDVSCTFYPLIGLGGEFT